MAETTFETGDTVILKSGGPQMTISPEPKNRPEDLDENHVLCLWFTNQNDIKTLWLHKAMIKEAK